MGPKQLNFFKRAAGYVEKGGSTGAAVERARNGPGLPCSVIGSRGGSGHNCSPDTVTRLFPGTANHRPTNVLYWRLKPLGHPCMGYARPVAALSESAFS